MPVTRVGNPLTLSFTAAKIVNCKAIYGAVTENIWSILTNYQHVQSQAASKAVNNNIAYTPGEGSGQWSAVKSAWFASTLAGATTSGGQRSLVYQVGAQNYTTGEYTLDSRLAAGVSLWNTSTIVGKRVFQVRANRDQAGEGRVYFATYTDAEGRPNTSLETVYNEGQAYLTGWNWYSLGEPMTMKDRLLVACVPEDLTFRGSGAFWSVQEYGGVLNADSYRTRYYTEPV